MADTTVLVSDRIQSSLMAQTAHYDALIARIQTMFTVATAVAGIGLPLALEVVPVVCTVFPFL